MGEEMEEEKELEVGDEAEAPDQEEGQEGKAPSVRKRPAAVRHGRWSACNSAVAGDKA